MPKLRFRTRAARRPHAAPAAPKTVYKTHTAYSGRVALVALAIIAGVAAGSPPPAHAQAAVETQAGGARAHVLVGGFLGRLDLRGAGETDLLGGRAGVGFGELVQLTGFYWRGFDRSEEAVTADHAWGGELQFNLNAGFGVTPFVVGGVARVNQDGSAAQTAAVAGAGLVFPLGPVLLHVGARDYMFGVTGMRDSESPEDVTHNWLYGAGVTFAVGRRRGARVAVVPAPAPPAGVEAERAALRAATAELEALRDSIRATRAAGVDVPPDMLARAGVDQPGTRNYHSTQQIAIPIPTEGSITLRYGPETAAAPVVITPQGTVSSAVVPGSVSPGTAPPAAPAAAVPPPLPPAGARLDDPATQAWLQQLVAAQVAGQLALRPAASATQAQLDAIAQRALDGVVAAMLPRLEAAQAQRMNLLREELRRELMGRPAPYFTEAAPPAAPAPDWRDPDPIGAPAAPGTVPPAPRPDTPVTPDTPAAAPLPADPALVSDEAEARAGALQRVGLAEAAAGYPTFIGALETERGPAAVLGDAAFASGAALLNDAARPAIAAVARVLRAHPDRRVYVQGHTDAVGVELQNQRLSELRAETVRSLLVQEGLDPLRIFAIGYGAARPVADNTTPRGRALNRRVEIVIGETGAASARADNR
jgi:outer membrane protein OmpA-like peptidoglycan-associated protein